MWKSGNKNSASKKDFLNDFVVIFGMDVNLTF